MIKALSFCAFLIICLWYGPWWSISLLGIFYGLTYYGPKPVGFSLVYCALGFALIYVLIWITDSHSGFKGGAFLSEYLATPPFMLYGVSAFLFSIVLAMSCMTGTFLAQARRANY